MARVLSCSLISSLSIMMLAACGTDDASQPGTLMAQISCIARDSLLATVYLTNGESGGTSQWCACGSEACAIEFGGLGYGAYVLSISVPDSLYKVTEGAEGFTRTLGFYGEGGLSETADTITISEEQPSASINVDVDQEPASGLAQ